MTSEILWVAVPNGLKPPASTGTSPTQALIRVLMVPRLGQGSISDFDLADWPQRLSDAAEFDSIFVRTRIGSGPAGRPVRPKAVTPASSDAWRGFFSGDAGQINGFVPKTTPTPKVRPTFDQGVRAHVTHRNVTQSRGRPSRLWYVQDMGVSEEANHCYST